MKANTRFSLLSGRLEDPVVNPHFESCPTSNSFPVSLQVQIPFSFGLSVRGMRHAVHNGETTRQVPGSMEIQVLKVCRCSLSDHPEGHTVSCVMLAQGKAWHGQFRSYNGEQIGGCHSILIGFPTLVPYCPFVYGSSEEVKD